MPSKPKGTTWCWQVRGGSAAWEHFLTGSTAKRLIRKCPAAVWIVKAEHVGPPKAVLAAMDFSAVSFKAVRHTLPWRN